MNGRIATLMVHTSPLDQPGIGDAGGMNIYVVEAAQRMAAMGVEVDIFTRRTNPEQGEIVEISKGVRVRHFACGHGALTKEELPAHINGLSKEFLRSGSYFNLIQPFQHHENTPMNAGINVHLQPSVLRYGSGHNQSVIGC